MRLIEYICNRPQPAMGIVDTCRDHGRSIRHIVRSRQKRSLRPGSVLHKGPCSTGLSEVPYMRCIPLAGCLRIRAYARCMGKPPYGNQSCGAAGLKAMRGMDYYPDITSMSRIYMERSLIGASAHAFLSLLVRVTGPSQTCRYVAEEGVIRRGIAWARKCGLYQGWLGVASL